MSKLKFKIKLAQEILGSCNANPDLHREQVAGRSKDAEKVKEEMAHLPAEELLDKATTVFSRDDDGSPIIWDFQIRGQLKEALGVLLDLPDWKETSVGKTKISKYTHKRIVDNFIFVTPRRIKLCEPTTLATFTRPLRGQTMQGERVALVTSEVVPASEFTIEVHTLHPVLDDLVRKCLAYGQWKGLGQFRNGGYGRFHAEELTEADAKA
jgi:hypothetical protein